MNPPSGDPMSGPVSAGAVSHASAPIISDLAPSAKSTSRPTGVIIAPPMRCSTRAATNSHNVVEKPQAMEPSMNTAMAAGWTWVFIKTTVLPAIIRSSLAVCLFRICVVQQ